MNARYWLRSTLFNLLFYIVTFIACVIMIPTLFMPRGIFMYVVHGWTGTVGLLEKYVLGLRYQIKGLEHLPPSGSYIIAAKHESPYETMKLHTLFGDPAIILKQELLKIPLWGKYLAKIDPIAIDRSNPDSAVASIQAGAQHVKEQGRPIVIFPQGTRVWPYTTSKEKPYKVGVARIQEATALPIIPLALNTGYFWPRQGWCKRPGLVTFEFLPAIPTGLKREALLQQLESVTEAKSKDLTKEAIAKENDRKKSKLRFAVLTFLVALAAGYSWLWFSMAEIVEREHALFLKTDKELAKFQDQAIAREFSGASVSGFPGPMVLKVAREDIRFPTAMISIDNFQGKSWPLMNMPVEIQTGALAMQDIRMVTPITFDSFEAKFNPKGPDLEVEYAIFRKADLEIRISGMVRNLMAPTPEIDLNITAKNYPFLIENMIEQKMLAPQSARFILAGLQALEKDGELSVPLTSQGSKIYVGPFLIADTLNGNHFLKH